MQNIFKTTVTCPKCGAQSEFTIYNFVNEKEQPGVGMIIGGYTAHLYICPKCDTRVLYPYPTIYEDLENNVVFAYATDKEKAKQMREKFKTVKAQQSDIYGNCKLRVFTNLENFVDAVGMHAFEYHFDEEGYREFEKHMQEVEEMLGCN